MAMNVEAEIRDLKRRVSELEGSFGFLTRQVKDVHKDVLAFQARTEQRFERVDRRLDKVDGRLDRVEGKLDQVDRGLRGMRDDMPGIVGDAVRTALRDRGPKTRKTP
jgi:archaellum component FlaC